MLSLGTSALVLYLAVESEWYCCFTVCTWDSDLCACRFSLFQQEEDKWEVVEFALNLGAVSHAASVLGTDIRIPSSTEVDDNMQCKVELTSYATRTKTQLVVLQKCASAACGKWLVLNHEAKEPHKDFKMFDETQSFSVSSLGPWNGNIHRCGSCKTIQVKRGASVRGKELVHGETYTLQKKNGLCRKVGQTADNTLPTRIRPRDNTRPWTFAPNISAWSKRDPSLMRRKIKYSSLRFFTHGEIMDHVAARTLQGIENYKARLMRSATIFELEGIWFDTSRQAWVNLVKDCLESEK